MQNISASKVAIDVFHMKIVGQITFQLRKYEKLKPIKEANHSQNLNEQDDDYFGFGCISQFLYDILELENSSIDFIMKQIFQSGKRSSWHLEQILKIVIDVQFIITVNNFILGKWEASQKRKMKQQEILFLKIQLPQLVSVIYQNCFFLESTSNRINKQTVEKIVQQINEENGSKGHILMIQYKNFMIHNILEKHNPKKFFTPKKVKTLQTPLNNKEKYHSNSLSIKEVDEQSQTMGRSNRNFGSMDIGGSQIQLKEESKVINQKKVLQSEQVKNFSPNIENITAQNKIAEKQKDQNDSKESFRDLLWQSLKVEIIPKRLLNLDKNGQNQISQELERILRKKEQNFPLKNLQRMKKKMQKYLTSEQGNLSQLQIVSNLIRLFAEQSFKIFHDEITKIQKTRFYLTLDQFRKILENAFIGIIVTKQIDQLLKNQVELVFFQKKSKKWASNSIKSISFKQYFEYIQTLSQQFS